MTTAFFLEILFLGLMGLAILYCAVLNARLKRFQGAGNDLRGTINELKDTIARAETAIATLKAMSNTPDVPGGTARGAAAMRHEPCPGRRQAAAALPKAAGRAQAQAQAKMHTQRPHDTPPQAGRRLKGNAPGDLAGRQAHSQAGRQARAPVRHPAILPGDADLLSRRRNRAPLRIRNIGAEIDRMNQRLRERRGAMRKAV